MSGDLCSLHRLAHVARTTSVEALLNELPKELQNVVWPEGTNPLSRWFWGSLRLSSIKQYCSTDNNMDTNEVEIQFNNATGWRPFPILQFTSVDPEEDPDDMTRRVFEPAWPYVQLLRFEYVQHGDTDYMMRFQLNDEEVRRLFDGNEHRYDFVTRCARLLIATYLDGHYALDMGHGWDFSLWDFYFERNLTAVTGDHSSTPVVIDIYTSRNKGTGLDRVRRQLLGLS